MEYYTGSVCYAGRIRHVLSEEGSITESYMGPQALNLYPISLEPLEGAGKYCFISPIKNRYVADLDGVSRFTAGLIRRLPYGYPIPVGGRVCFVPCEKFRGYAGYELKGVGCLNDNLSAGRPKLRKDAVTGIYGTEFRAWDPHSFILSGGRGFFTAANRTTEVRGGLVKGQAVHEFGNLSKFNRTRAPPSDRPLFVSAIPAGFFSKGVQEEERVLFGKRLEEDFVRESGGLAILGRAVTTPIRFSWLYDAGYRRRFYGSLGISGREEKREYLRGCIGKFAGQLKVLLRNGWYHSSLHAQNVRADGCMTDFTDVHKIEDAEYAARLMASHLKSLMTDSALFAPEGKVDGSLLADFLREMFGEFAPERDIEKHAKLFGERVYAPWRMSAGHHFLAVSLERLLSQKVP